MSVKVDSAVAAFHSQLSSILEKLVVFAVEEIKQLVFEYCEDLSQEKTQNRALSESVEADQDQRIYRADTSFCRELQDGNSETGFQELTTQLESSGGEENEEKPAQGQHVKLLVQPLEVYPLNPEENFFVGCKFEQGATVSPENPPTDEEGDYSQSQEAAEHCLEPQFCSDPPEDSKDLLTDYKQTVETQCTSYKDISPSEEHRSDVEFQIKREAQSPDIETELQMQTGQLESGAGQIQPFAQETMLVDCKFAVDTACPETFSATCEEGDCGRSQDAAKWCINTPFSCDPSTSEDHHSRLEFQIKRKSGSMASESVDNNSGVHQTVHKGTYTTTPLDISELGLDPSALSLPKQHINTYTSRQGKKSQHHLKALTGTKRMEYKCDFCNKTFIFPSQLKDHRLSHTKERTHVCGVCGRGFIRKSDMRRHEMMHLNLRPFLCTICGYKSSRSSYMKLHVKRHHVKQRA